MRWGTFGDEIEGDKVLHNGGVVAVDEVGNGLDHAILHAHKDHVQDHLQHCAMTDGSC